MIGPDGDGISFFKYVPNGFVHVWEQAGWVALPSLNGTGHGLYSTLMKAGPNCPLKDGEPICPQVETAA